MLDDKHINLAGNMNEGEVPFYCGASDGRDILKATDVTAVEADARLESSTHDGCERTLVKIASFNDTDRVVGVTSIESRLEDAGKDDRNISDRKDLNQGTCSVLMETEYQRTTVSTLEEVGKDDEVKRLCTNIDKRVGESSESARLTKKSKTSDSIQQKTNTDTEDDKCDTLKSAHLVAKVERDVNHNEQPGNSYSAGGIREPNRPAAINGEQDMAINGPARESRTMDNVSSKVTEKEPLHSSAKTKTNLENVLVTDAVKEPEGNAKKCLLDELSSEDLDKVQVDAISNHKSVVSAFRDLVASGNPAIPLKFEGCTSAFQPASPCWTSDSYRALSGGAIGAGSQQRQDFLNVDLNVAEDGDGVNHMSAKGKQMLVSGESSDELSSAKSDKSKFDVNQSEEDENVPSSNSNDSSDSNPSTEPSVTLSDNRDAPKRKRVGKKLSSTFSFNTYITERIDAMSTAREEAIKVMNAKLEIEEAMLELKKKKLERQTETMMVRMQMKILNTLLAKQNLTPDEETMKLKLINKLYP